MLLLQQLLKPAFRRRDTKSGYRASPRKDADAIQKEITLAKTVAPELSNRYQVTAKGTNTNTSVIGTTVAYPAVRNVQIDTGSFITEQNVKTILLPFFSLPLPAFLLLWEASAL